MKVLNSTTLLGFASSCKQALKVVMVNEQVAVCPARSVAVQVTVVVPTGKVLPDGGLQTTTTPGQLFESVAEGVAKVTTVLAAGGQDGGATAVTPEAGQVMTGAGLVTVVVAVDELLLVSDSGVVVETVAVLLSTVPLGTEQLTLTTIVTVNISPPATVGLIAVTVPFVPTIGVVNVEPGEAAADMNTVPAGRLSVTVTSAAAVMLLLVAVMV